MKKASFVSGLSEKLAPLRRDIDFLATLLGEVVEMHAGESVFKAVEHARAATRKLRERYDADAENKFLNWIETLDLETSTQVIRTFALYFQLVNLAEEVHRVRRKRHYENLPQHPPQKGSLEEIALNSSARGVTPPEIQKFLNQLSIEIVFTAPPTEAQRQTILTKLLRIALLLIDHERAELDSFGRANLSGRKCAAKLMPSGRPKKSVSRKISPMDEADNGLFYLDQVLFDRIPRTLEKLEQHLNQFYGRRIRVPEVLRVGSWMGGDRDANPFVTHEITRQVAEKSRLLALHKYWKSVDDLVDRCSLSEDWAPPSASLAASLRADAKRYPKHARTLEGRFLHEPYRQKLSFMKHKLQATAEGRKGYRSSEAFLQGRLIDCRGTSVRQIRVS